MKITLIEGLGFAEQAQLQAELSLHDITVNVCDFDQAFSPAFKGKIENTTLLVFRARWSATVEENLFIKTMLKKHQAYFEVLDEMVKNKKIKILAIGRGALLWLEWLNFTKRLGSPLSWAPFELLTNSWIETKVSTQQHTTMSIRSMVSGRALLTRLDLGRSAVAPWVDYNGQTVGWIVDGHLYLSLVDVFALSERAQLPDYGYEDLSSISTRANLFQMLLSGEM